MNRPVSGSIPQEETVIRAGFQISPTEFYVIPGDVIIGVYKYLTSQRTSAVAYLAKFPPTYRKMIEEYLAIYSDLNETMYQLVSAVPLANILQTIKQSEQRANETKSSKKPLAVEDIDIREFMKRFRIDSNGKQDEMPPPTNGGEKKK